MKLTNLSLYHYRNYKELSLSFPQAINIFLGENAQGKTNLLESIYVLALTKSHRTHQEKELIYFGEKEARVSGLIETRHGNVPLEVGITSKGKRTKLNHIEQKKLSEYVGHFNVILFSPEDLYLVKGSPQIRRKFIDMELGQIRPLYLYQLVSYQNILKQRNLYLKQMSEDKKFDALYFEILTDQFVSAGAQIIMHRLAFLERLEKLAQDIHQSISHGKEQLTFRYQCSFPLPEECTSENIADALKESLKKNEKRERFKQSTLFGPHRDDLQFFINQNNVQHFASQGQQRTTALSLKLAEIEVMKEETREYPVLLLDDVMSELDNERQIHLLKSIQGKVQTFLTTTTLEHIEEPMKTLDPAIFYVAKGQVERNCGS